MAEPTTNAVRSLASEDPVMLVWWGTEVECVSALARLERQGDLADTATVAALERLDAMAFGWHEVQPIENVRRTARRLLRVHGLRAADAMQLAAAIIGSEDNPPSLEIMTLDERLAIVARREGFPVLEPT